MGTRADQPSFRDLYTPKLVTVLREGYGLAVLQADAISGLTVAIVALPLSMAIAIASADRAKRRPYDPTLASDPDIVDYRISGAFFFGAAGAVAAALDRIGEQPRFRDRRLGRADDRHDGRRDDRSFAGRAVRQGVPVVIAGAERGA